MDNYKEEKSLENEYFHLISLLIQDNTNKDLVKKYLLFLKEYEKSIKIKNKETYKDELNFYKVMFEPQEVKVYFLEEKDFSERNEFINLINELSNITKENYENLKKGIDEKKLGRFNQKIDFNNNKELYWYRNKSLILY